MKFTYSWLKDHLEPTASFDQIVERLSLIGLEVEGAEDKAKQLAPFVVGEVLTAEKHPNADKLRVCTVSIGKGDPIQVVCGAPNARAGLKTVFAAPGTVIPTSGLELKIGKIRDVESRGMLCSAREMGLSEEHDGILELPEDAPRGRALRGGAGAERPGDRDRRDAQPRRLPRRLRRCPRPRRRRSRRADGAAGEARRGHLPRPAEGDAGVRRDLAALPRLCPSGGEGRGRTAPPPSGCRTACAPSACAPSTRWWTSPIS